MLPMKPMAPPISSGAGPAIMNIGPPNSVAGEATVSAHSTAAAAASASNARACAILRTSHATRRIIAVPPSPSPRP